MRHFSFFWLSTSSLLLKVILFKIRPLNMNIPLKGWDWNPISQGTSVTKLNYTGDEYELLGLSSGWGPLRGLILLTNFFFLIWYCWPIDQRISGRGRILFNPTQPNSSLILSPKQLPVLSKCPSFFFSPQQVQSIYSPCSRATESRHV